MRMIGLCLCDNAAWASVNLDYFLERAVSGGWFRRDSSGVCSKQEPAQCLHQLKILRNSFHGKDVSTPLYRRACTGACAFFAVSVACMRTGVLSTSACTGVYIIQVFRHQHTHLRTHSLQGVHMRSCMRSVIISVEGRGCESRGRNETPGGPEKSRCIKSGHTFIRMCTKYTCVYIY